MRFRKALTIALCVMLVMAGVGCKRAPKSVEITDPAELEKLWQEYFYESIATVGNTFNFKSVADIDPIRGIASFCWFKYIDEHGVDSLQPESPGSSLRVFPLEKALPYAQRYFNLTSLDLSKSDSIEYDPQRKAFLFAMSLSAQRPTYNSGTAWGQTLTKATDNGDGTVTVVLTEKDSASGRTVLTMTYTMARRDDGSLYFVSGKQEYVNNHLVTVTGDYQRFDGIKGFDGRVQELVMLGEADGKLILAHVPGADVNKGELLLVNASDMSLGKRLAVKGLSQWNATLTADGVLVRLADKYVLVDKSLSRSTETKLPEAVLAATQSEAFWGYDVDPATQTYVYMDGISAKLIEPDGQERMLFKTRGDNGTLNRNPRFVAGGQRVIAALCGYDGVIGYTVHDITTGNTGTYMIASGGVSTDMIRYDTGLLELNKFQTNDGGASGFYATLYLDFATEEVRQVPVADKGDTDSIPAPYQVYVGQNRAAFITTKLDAKDNVNSLYTINRLDPSTMKVEPALITVKAANTGILGVLADGRIVFWYDLNPSERGIGITK